MTRTLNEWKRARWTWVYLFSLFVVQFLIESGIWGEKSAIYRSYGLSRTGLHDGHFPSIFTHGLIHASWTHTICNTFMLLIMGARLESWIGVRCMNFILLGGTLGGAVFHLMCGGTANDVLVGASGVVMAMVMVFCTLSPQSRMWPLPVSARNLGWGLLTSSLLLMLVNPSANITGLSRLGAQLVRWGCADWFRIGHACHFGGALIGWLYARWLLRVPLTKEQLQQQRLRNDTRRSN
ncbi:MAG: hypothetical protein RLZZ553_1250 [Verrucomicrobiota bacterium]